MKRFLLLFGCVFPLVLSLVACGSADVVSAGSGVSGGGVKSSGGVTLSAAPVVHRGYSAFAPEGVKTELGEVVREEILRVTYRNEGFEFDVSHPVASAFEAVSFGTVVELASQVDAYVHGLGRFDVVTSDECSLGYVDSLTGSSMKFVSAEDVKGLYSTYMTVVTEEDFISVLNFDEVSEYFCDTIGLVISGEVLKQVTDVAVSNIDEPWEDFAVYVNADNYSALRCYFMGDESTGTYTVSFVFLAEYIPSLFGL